MRVLFATPVHATLASLTRHRKSHTLWRLMMEAGRSEGGRGSWEGGRFWRRRRYRSFAVFLGGDSNPLLFWECLSVCLPGRSSRMRLQVVFAVYLEQCSPAAINQIESLGEKRGERERRRARRG